MSEGIRVATGVHKKTPDEVRAFSLTFADALVAGEVIHSVSYSSVTVDGTTGLVIDSIQIEGPLLNITTSGGVAGSFYFILARVLTNLGQVLEGVVTVSVQKAV